MKIEIKIKNKTLQIEGLDGEYYAFGIKNLGSKDPHSFRGLLRILDRFFGRENAAEVRRQLSGQTKKLRFFRSLK